MLSEVVTVVLGAAASVGTLLVGLAAYRKWGPEARKIKVDTVDVNVKIAGELRDDAWESFDRLRNEMKDLRKLRESDRLEFEQYQHDTEARMTELSVAVRSEKALRMTVQQENVHIREENRQLRERIATLEQEVASLKNYNTRSESGGNPHI